MIRRTPGPPGQRHLAVLSSVGKLFFFFFNDTATTEIYTLSLHDALPISIERSGANAGVATRFAAKAGGPNGDRKSTRLNSSHSQISYAVFCLKKKKKSTPHPSPQQ